MSKSHKKRKERDRAQSSETPHATSTPSSPLDEALLERVVTAVRASGVSDGPGTWLYNGDALSIKLVEGDGLTPRRLLVAAFQQGIVFQVEGERQVVRRPGEWTEALPTGPAT